MASTIDEQIANYRQLRAIQVESLAETDAILEALVKAKKILDQEVTVALTAYDGRQNLSEWLQTQGVVQRIRQTDLDISPVVGTATIPEAMFAWADAHDGKLDGKELAPVLRKSGHSAAKSDQSVMATITNFATRSYAEHWTKVGPNRFERKFPEPESAPGPENGTQGQQESPTPEHVNVY